jgi:hypothetical protein
MVLKPRLALLHNRFVLDR